MSDDSSQNGDSKQEGNELSKLLDPNYPLLKKFRDTCPGTYKHSQNLSSMVEGVSISLGLDVSYMKVASIYHDIGKMINPSYFSENQVDSDNPHDKLDPRISYQIISRHVSDTAMILMNDDNFPRELIQMASQHHGSTVMRYFFDKSGSEVDDYFRYKSEKPTRVEAAILMICDCIEARTRSELQKMGIDFNPGSIIEDTINSLLSDNQLDDVVMRLGDLQKIKDALCKELQGTYQKRVDYSKAKEESDSKKK